MLIILSVSACSKPQQPKEETAPPNQESQTSRPPIDSGDPNNLMNQLPPDWPDSVPVMPGFEIINSLILHEGKLLVVNCIGNVNMDEAQNYYAGLDGWSRYPPGAWITTGDQRYVSLINDKQEKLEVVIMSGQLGVGLSLRLDSSET
jgi:hypothetical protein